MVRRTNRIYRRKRDHPAQLRLWERTTRILPELTVPNLAAIAASEPARPEPSSEEPVTLEHGKNFRIQKIYLEDHLAQHNRNLQKGLSPDQVTYDNVLLRFMYSGIQNSLDTPAEIFEAFNAFEICLLEAGIWKRKFVHDDKDTPNSAKANRVHEKSRRDHDLSTHSRIYYEGPINGSLYDLVDFLFDANKIPDILEKYQGSWPALFANTNPDEKQRRSKRLNPYDPSTLRQRVESIEAQYPQAVEQFKEVLAKPWIPGREASMDSHGNPIGYKNDAGFEEPLPTYRSGITGSVFPDIGEYAKRVLRYFQQKEREFQSNT